MSGGTRDDTPGVTVTTGLDFQPTEPPTSEPELVEPTEVLAAKVKALEAQLAGRDVQITTPSTIRMIGTSTDSTRPTRRVTLPDGTIVLVWTDLPFAYRIDLIAAQNDVKKAEKSGNTNRTADAGMAAVAALAELVNDSVVDPDGLRDYLRDPAVGLVTPDQYFAVINTIASGSLADSPEGKA